MRPNPSATAAEGRSIRSSRSGRRRSKSLACSANATGPSAPVLPPAGARTCGHGRQSSHLRTTHTSPNRHFSYVIEFRRSAGRHEDATTADGERSNLLAVAGGDGRPAAAAELRAPLPRR
jgi:hypothetical protein